MNDQRTHFALAVELPGDWHKLKDVMVLTILGFDNVLHFLAFLHLKSPFLLLRWLKIYQSMDCMSSWFLKVCLHFTIWFIKFVFNCISSFYCRCYWEVVDHSQLVDLVKGCIHDYVGFICLHDWHTFNYYAVWINMTEWSRWAFYLNECRKEHCSVYAFHSF